MSHTEKPNEFDTCHVSFKNTSLLEMHKMTHTGKKLYECNICHKTFGTASNVKQHKRTHTGERPYECDICHKTISHSKNIKRHERTHTGERPHKCDVCHKSFSTSSQLKRHRMTHTGERPHKCNVCHKSFPTSSELKRHKRTHTGERPHKCDVCHKSFTFSSHLKRHKRVHRGRSPYVCVVSQQTYSESSILTKQQTQVGTQEKPREYDVSCQSFTPQTKNIHRENIDSRPPYDRAPGFPYEFSPKKHNAYNESKHDFIDTGMNAHVLDKYDNGYTGETGFYANKAQRMKINGNEQGNGLMNDFEITGNGGTFKEEILHNCVQHERTPVNEIAADDFFSHEPSSQQLGLVQRNYDCDICEKPFTNIKELRSHKLIHIYLDL